MHQDRHRGESAGVRRQRMGAVVVALLTGVALLGAAPTAQAIDGAPGAPQNVEVTRHGNDLRITWDAAGLPPDGVYTVYDSVRKGYRTGGPDLREAWVWNVDPGQTYYVGVRAREFPGARSSLTASRLVGEKVYYPGPPGKPRNVQVKRFGNDLRITWDAPSSGNVGAYMVYDSRRKGYRIGGKGLRRAWLWNVEPGKTYYVGVRAKNSTGNGKMVGEKVRYGPSKPGRPRNVDVRAVGVKPVETGFVMWSV